MNSEQITPIVTTSKMRETRAFYVHLLGLELSFDHDHYLGVRAGPKGSPEIGFMLPDADSPDAFGGKGLALGVRVADADRECKRVRAAGAKILQEPTDMPWGARAFVTIDPNGVTLFVSHAIAATPEFAACMR